MSETRGSSVKENARTYQIIYVYYDSFRCGLASLLGPLVRRSITSSIHPSVHPSIRSPILPCIRSLVRPSVRPSIRPPILPSIRSSVHQAIIESAPRERKEWRQLGLGNKSSNINSNSNSIRANLE